MTIGEKIKILRKEKGLTQKELGAATDIAEITIRQYEAGKYKPKLEQLQKIAIVLDMGIMDMANTEKPSQTISLYNYLEAIGYKISLYEEDSYRATVLSDNVNEKRYSITDAELKHIEQAIESFARFQISEFIKRYEIELKKEYEADAAREEPDYYRKDGE